MLLAQLMSMVSKYLDGAISLRQLENWVAPRFRLLFAMPDSSVTDLAATIELGFAEIGDRVIDEDEFRNRLQAAVQQVEKLAITSKETMLDWSPSPLVAAIPVPSNASIQALPRQADAGEGQQWLAEILRNDRSEVPREVSPPPGNVIHS